jgi:glycosyltransferase involved in cell wall biosynthesis
MRILIDGTALLLPGAGVKNYLHYWLFHLCRKAEEPDRISIFPLLGHSVRPLDPSQSDYGGFSTAIRLAMTRSSNLFGTWVTDLLSGRVDLFHEPNTHVLNPPGGCKLTATIHDLTCWLMPELHLPENVAETKQFAARVLARADRIIAGSNHTRLDAAQILHIPEERIEVIQYGVADAFFQVSPDEISRVGLKYKLSTPYILFVGTIEPRKNIDNLIDAYLGMPQAMRNEVELVLVGPEGWRSQDVVARLRAGLQGVRWLGYVPEADIAGLTAGAAVFAYPSLYEGFGLPVAQAMAAGVPVLTSNVSSLPEVTGGAAVLVNPRDALEIGAGLERMLADDSLRRELSAKGIQRAADYRWDRCAAKSLEFFHCAYEDRETVRFGNSA